MSKIKSIKSSKIEDFYPRKSLAGSCRTRTS
jgi:hypothetical protein